MEIGKDNYGNSIDDLVHRIPMKQSEYIPISVREKIEDKNVAKIVDYLERNSGNFKKLKPLTYVVDDIEFYFCWKFFLIQNFYREEYLKGYTTLLADNIVGIWGSLKHY